MAKIPTKLYICVPRRSARGTFLSNAWVNLTRKDTGEGIQKPIERFLNDVSLGTRYTAQKTGYYGPDDMNPKTEGSHPYYVAFHGDDEFESGKSEEIMLKVDPSLSSFRQFLMQVTPISGDVPLTIQVNGFIEWKYPRIPPEYSLPLDLMVFDKTSIKTLKPVKTVLTNPDGTFTIEYTFTKPGTYAIFVNFLGDAKYISAWSNNGGTTTITVTGGVLPLSFEKTITEVVAAKAPRNYKFMLAATEPTAPDGYERAPEWDLDFGILGKYWAFRETVT